MAWLFGLAVVVRLVVAWRTAVPGRDGASYLWMAEEVAAGRIAGAFETVFHPVYSLLVGAVLAVAPGLDGVVAGQLVAGMAGAVAILPLCALTRHVFGRRAALACGFFYAVGIWFARHPADCMSEGPFYLVVATVVWLLAGCERPGARRLLTAGVLAGVAYGLRPEGLSLLALGAPWLWLRGQRRGAAEFGLVALGVGALWPLGFARWGGGLTLTPKLAFNYDVGVGAAESSGIAHYFGHLVQIPGDLLESIGYVAAPLAIAGLWLARPWSLRQPTALIAGLFALQVLVVPMLQSHFRFLSGYGFLMLAFAGATCSALWPRWKQLALPWRIAVVLLAVAGDVVRIPQARRTDRFVLRDVGQWLRPGLRDGDAVATDSPRLLYYAGLKPGPPRPISRADILDACKLAATRYAVVVKPRIGVTSADLAGVGFEPARLPGELQHAAASHSLLVYRRREK